MACKAPKRRLPAACTFLGGRSGCSKRTHGRQAHYYHLGVDCHAIAVISFVCALAFTAVQIVFVFALCKPPQQPFCFSVVLVFVHSSAPSIASSGGSTVVAKHSPKGTEMGTNLLGVLAVVGAAQQCGAVDPRLFARRHVRGKIAGDVFWRRWRLDRGDASWNKKVGNTAQHNAILEGLIETCIEAGRKLSECRDQPAFHAALLVARDTLQSVAQTLPMGENVSRKLELLQVGGGGGNPPSFK